MAHMAGNPNQLAELAKTNGLDGMSSVIMGNQSNPSSIIPPH